MQPHSWIEIDASALRQNVRLLRQVVSKQVLLAPCVKANAYGHGLVEVSRQLISAGADWLSVHCVEEAITLRESRITAPILVLGPLLASEYPVAHKLRVSLLVGDLDRIPALASVGSAKQPLAVHLKVDTGMSRQGVDVTDVRRAIELILRTQNLKLEGVATHFATSELSDELYREQHQQFARVLQTLESMGLSSLIIHAANSGAMLLDPTSHFRMVRPGLAVYGLYPSTEVRKRCQQTGVQLQPVLTWKTRIAQLKNIPQGAVAGYGATFTARRQTRVALLPVGYADGYDRRWSNCATVLVRGHHAPVIGRVSMDLVTVDVTDVGAVQMDDEVVLIGPQGHEVVSADHLAELADTISYEVISRLSPALERRMVGLTVEPAPATNGRRSKPRLWPFRRAA